MSIAFWENKSLEELTEREWESLCDGCGQCCLHKLIDADTDELYYTNVACSQLNLKTCACNHYDDRDNYEDDCIHLTLDNLKEIEWLPNTCAYRLLSENQALKAWHPLLTGSKDKMHQLKISVAHFAVKEESVNDWEDHIIERF